MPEVIGINLWEAKICDDEGNPIQNKPIKTDGASGCFSTVPVREMVSAMADAGLNASLSYSAGAFVCSDML